MVKINVKVNGKYSGQKSESDYASCPTDAFDFALNAAKYVSKRKGPLITVVAIQERTPGK